LTAYEFPEFAYNLPYMEKHGRAGSENPWSQRKTAVYCQHRAEDSSSTWVFLQGSKTLKQFFKKPRMSPLNKKHHMEIDSVVDHMTIFTILDDNWTEYIKYLDDQVTTYISSTFNEFKRRKRKEIWFKISRSQLIYILYRNNGL